MGLLNYFKPADKTGKKTSKKQKPVGPAGKDAEKTPAAPTATLDMPAVYLQPSAASSRLTLNEDQRDNIKHQVILNFLAQKQLGHIWIQENCGISEGVMVRKNRHEYLCRPAAMVTSPLVAAMSLLNVQAALTIKSEVIEPFISWNPDAIDVPLLNGLRVQIIPSFDDLYRAKRHQYAAFIAQDSLLVVWDDDPTKLFERAKGIEDELLTVVWQGEGEKGEGTSTPQPNSADPEAGSRIEERPIMYLEAFLGGCSMCLMVSLLGLGFGEIALEVAVLEAWSSLALLILTPIYMFLSLFFTNIIVKVIAQFFGPIQQMSRNSRYFSAVCAPRLTSRPLPHVTIQCPVYKEGLNSVIAPTVFSIKKAISTYELQGGSANIFINDDGMQLISEEDRQARMDFYSDHGVGWTARPGHNVDGYVRKGRFKKASNMNYGLALSNQVEEMLSEVDRLPGWSQSDEARAYEQCLKSVLELNPRAWADGYIRVGDYILIIDSDTRVPEDCLLDAASEMEQSPEVAIIQFSSGVMQVAYNFFENGITFFTTLIYTAIRYGVSNGDVAAFVGHNAILRWSAVQEVAFVDEDGQECFWSESCVSEDFDMALRLQLNRYVIRMAAWADNGFKEGVSLTVYDELTRWQKYAYGCNELVFYPCRYWFTKGPFTPLFKRFIKSGINVGSKINMIAYIGTYYAIGSAWIITLANYFAVGLYNGYLDKYYLDSWKNWVAIIVVFGIAGNIGLAVQRHRSGEKSFVPAVIENFKWATMFAVFFGGLSLHMSQAILCHMFEIPLTWGATAKEVEFSNFFLEVPKVLKNFRWTFIMCISMLVGMCIMATGTFIPWSYNITAMVAIFPLAVICFSHLLLPIGLNPEMMTFSW